MHWPDSRPWLCLLVGAAALAAPPAPVRPGAAPAAAADLSAVADPGARAEKVADGFGATDGVAYSRLAFVWFSDPERDALLSYTPALKFVSGKSIGETASTEPVKTVRQPAGGVRGLTLDRQGRLITCESRARRVTRTEKDGKLTVLAERYRGKPLNGPLDAVHAIDGSTYFTDAAGSGGPSGIYQITRKGDLRLVARDFKSAAGVTLSADHMLLYATDASSGQIREFEILPDGGLGAGKVVATLTGEGRARAGGIKTDIDGRLYCAGPGGVSVFERTGSRLGTLAVPEPVVNLGWGDDYSALYVAAGSSLYRIKLKTSGTRTF